MKKFFATILAMTSLAATAGEMLTQKDKFTGETSVVYISTAKEAVHSKAVVVIRKGFKGLAHVRVSAYPLRVTDCNDNYVFLKDSKGKIHKIDAIEVEHNYCQFGIELEHIEKGFDIRMPMYRDGNLDFSFSTKGMKFEQLTD
jgi:hypothetical protein